MRSKAGNVLLFLTLFATACGDDTGDEGEELDGSMQPSETLDGGKADAGASDAGGGALDATAAEDASSTADAAALDGAMQDASENDAGATDAAAPDAATGDAAVAATTFTRVYEILMTNCASCHSSTASLKMHNKAAAYAGLVDANTTTGGACGGSGRKRVVKNDAANSILIRKLEGGPELCGARMPKDASPLPSAQIAEIKSWINAGALNN